MGLRSGQWDVSGNDVCPCSAELIRTSWWVHLPVLVPFEQTAKEATYRAMGRSPTVKVAEFPTTEALVQVHG